jgi:uncharacterized protein DUF6959
MGKKIAVERMWATVAERHDGFYVGILDNQPAGIQAGQGSSRGSSSPFAPSTSSISLIQRGSRQSVIAADGHLGRVAPRLLAAEWQVDSGSREASMSGSDDRAVDVELWSPETNRAVVRVPGRRFPGVVIQGDSLSILFDLAMYLSERLPETSDEELRGAADDLAEKLFAHVQSYEAVLQARGVSLPYTRDPRRVPRRSMPDAD